MVSYYENDKRRQVTQTAHTKREAERIKTALLTHIDNGTLAEPKGTLGEFLNRWLEEYAIPNLSPTTVQEYKNVIFTHINPDLGNVNLKNLRPEHLQKYYAAKLSNGLSTTTVRHHAMMLHRVLDHAVKWGLLARNPADAVSPPKMRHTEMKVLQQSDIEVVLAEARKTPYYALFFTALMTGMRRSELLGLRWSDVNLILAELSVNRAMHRLQNHEVIYRTPKSEKSRRVVALSPATCKVLRDHWESQTALRMRFSILVKDDVWYSVNWTDDHISLILSHKHGGE
jgi:integrase